MNSNPSRPDLVIIAGPNGAGKSTVADFLLENRSIQTFVNADAIAKGLHAHTKNDSDILAGRIMLEQLHSCMKKRESVAFESTMAGMSWTRLLESAKSLGYDRTICFLAVSSPEIALSRVRQRVSVGGHDIPEATVRRRYSRSFEQFFNHYQRLCDTWYFFDNSGESALLLASRENGKLKRLNSLFESYERRYKKH